MLRIFKECELNHDKKPTKTSGDWNGIHMRIDQLCIYIPKRNPSRFQQWITTKFLCKNFGMDFPIKALSTGKFTTKPPKRPTWMKPFPKTNTTKGEKWAIPRF